MYDPLLPVLAASVLLLLASLLVPLAKRLKVPHTVLLALLGMALGLIAAAVPPDSRLGPVGDLLTGMTSLGLEPDVFLAVFLPPLLFAAGLVIDVRRVIEEAWAVLLMAVVAVFVATAVIGFAVHAGVGIGLLASLLLAAIIATTDPAAVVAIFRDLGAPKRLTTLVQGESLLNDAAAIALFSVLISILLGTGAPHWGSIAIEFATGFVGGAVLGFVLGRAALWVMPRLGGDTTSEATAALALCYLSYTVAQVYGGVSGVVAVVFAALTVAAYGPLRLTRHNWRSLVETWTQIDFWASSLIFILAAMLAARLVAGLTPLDAGVVLFIALLAIFARVVVLYGMLPLLVWTRLTRPIGDRFKLVIIWGGLRGATTLVLALAVAQMPGLPIELRETVAGLAVGFVFFTLVLAAPTLRPLLRLLGLDRLDPLEAALRDRVLRLSQVETRRQMETTAQQYALDASTLDHASVELDVDAEAGSDDVASDVLSSDDQLRVGLLTLATHEKELYLRHFEELTVSRSHLANLAVAADRLADRVRAEGLAAWQAATRRGAVGTRRFEIALWLHRRLGLDAPLERALESRFETLLISRRVLGELLEYNRTALQPLFGDAVYERLDALLGERLQATEAALGALQVQFPEYAQDLAAEHIQRAALRMEAANYRERLEEQLISAEVYDHLERELERRRARIRSRPPLDLGLRLGDLMRHAALFADLPADKAKRIGKLLKPRLATPGERVVAKGDWADGMYFIASGALEVRSNGISTPLPPGSFFGEMGLIDRQPRSADVYATAYSHLLFLDARDFDELLATDAEIRERIVVEAAARRAALSAHPQEGTGTGTSGDHPTAR
jgi:monovalent cation:H+ antiporter, CPA1 family